VSKEQMKANLYYSSSKVSSHARHARKLKETPSTSTEYYAHLCLLLR